MAKLYCEHLQQDIDQYLRSTAEQMVDKTAIQQKMVDKWSLKPTLAGKLADIIEFMADKEEIKTEHLVSELGLTETTAKIKQLLKAALTDKINDRETFMKGIDYSYYYEQED